MWDRIGFGRGEYIGLMASYLLLFTHFSTLLSVLLLLSLWLVTGGLTWCYLAYHTLPRDLRLLCRGLKLLLRMAYVKVHDTNIVQCFRNTVSAYPNRVMYVMLCSLRFLPEIWPLFFERTGTFIWFIIHPHSNVAPSRVGIILQLGSSSSSSLQVRQRDDGSRMDL